LPDNAEAIEFSDLSAWQM